MNEQNLTVVIFLFCLFVSATCGMWTFGSFIYCIQGWPLPDFSMSGFTEVSKFGLVPMLIVLIALWEIANSDK